MCNLVTCSLPLLKVEITIPMNVFNTKLEQINMKAIDSRPIERFCFTSAWIVDPNVLALVS